MSGCYLFNWWGCQQGVLPPLECSSGCSPPRPRCCAANDKKKVSSEVAFAENRHKKESCFRLCAAYVRKSLTSSTVSSPVDSRVMSPQLRGESRGVSEMGEDTELGGSSARPAGEQVRTLLPSFVSTTSFVFDLSNLASHWKAENNSSGQQQSMRATLKWGENTVM